MKMPIDNEWVTTITALAAVLKVSRQTIHSFQKLAGFPKKTAKGFNVAECRAFLLANSEKLKETQEGPSNLKERKTSEEIRKLKLANDLKEGALIKLTEVCRHFQEMVSTFQGTFGNLPRTMATELSGLGPVEIESILKTKIDKAFEELSRGGGRYNEGQ